MLFHSTTLGSLYMGDCMDIIKDVADKSVDMILCDLPYGTTKHAWDKRLPLAPLWREYWRVSKSEAAIVLTAQQPFVTDLIIASRRYFRYEIIWEKQSAQGFLNANRMPLRAHENILVFYKRLPKYRPQMSGGKPYVRKGSDKLKHINGRVCADTRSDNRGTRYPRSVVRFGKSGNSGHPTEKPLALFEWLVKTYTEEGDTVLDNCLGSGTTALVCEVNGRRWIGIEKEPGYCEMARKRIAALCRPGA